jgi:hypothetical protein
VLAELWRSGTDFSLIEHDIVIHDMVVSDLEAYPHEWWV